jgi:hypothetical protein
MRYLLAQGRTRPDKRLITISTKPIEMCFFLGQIIVLNTLPMVTLPGSFFDAMKREKIFPKVTYFG